MTLTLLVGIAAALLALRPRFTLRWLRRGLIGWQLARRLQARFGSLAGRL